MLVIFAMAAALAVAPEAAALDDLARQDARVAEAAFRLSVANADLCPQTGPLTGLVLHAASQYGEEIRPHAVRRFHLGDTPSILAVAPGGPADRAGLAPGDRLLAIGGRPAPAAAPSGEASYAVVAAAEEALRAGTQTLTISRDGETHEVLLTPVTGCAYPVQTVPDGKLNASADGRRVSISTELAAFTADDDELAVVIAHELAHNVLRHPPRTLGARRQEREADRLGLYLAARAGYDIEAAAPFWRRFGSRSLAARLGVVTHPSAGSRARVVERIAAEIGRKQARGEPLIP